MKQYKKIYERVLTERADLVYAGGKEIKPFTFKIVIELETLFSTSNLTKEKYETYAKNITELMESVK